MTQQKRNVIGVSFLIAVLISSSALGYDFSHKSNSSPPYEQHQQACSTVHNGYLYTFFDGKLEQQYKVSSFGDCTFTDASGTHQVVSITPVGEPTVQIYVPDTVNLQFLFSKTPAKVR